MPGVELLLAPPPGMTSLLWASALSRRTGSGCLALGNTSSASEDLLIAWISDGFLRGNVHIRGDWLVDKGSEANP